MTTRLDDTTARNTETSFHSYMEGTNSDVFTETATVNPTDHEMTARYATPQE